MTRRRRSLSIAVALAAAALLAGLTGCNPGAATQASANAESQPAANATGVSRDEARAPVAASSAPAPAAPAAVAAPAAPAAASAVVAKPHPKGVQAPAKAPAEAGPAPVIACDEQTFDFGSATQGSDVVHNFTVRNDGAAPLVLERADAG